MKIRSKIIQRIMIDICCILAVVLLLLLWQLKATMGLSEQLQKALTEEERLIDYTVEGKIAYIFVSTTEDREYGDRFLVLEQRENGEWERSYENDFSGLKPWKLRLSDIDGDGEKELLCAVRKTTFYDREEKNRLFIFNYKEDKLVKKWTGSDIAGSWEDFITGELVDTKGEEIIFITATDAGLEKLFIYHWFDFGFLMLAQSGDFEDVLKVEIVGESKLGITYNEGQKKSERFQLVKGNVLKMN